MSEIVASRVNITRAVGSENFEKTRPVTSAVKTREITDSTTTSAFAPFDDGHSVPYPWCRTSER